jgi:hypothetical protein
MDTMLRLTLWNRHNFNVAGGIVLSAFTNIVTQANGYHWAINPWRIAGITGLVLFMPAGWLLLYLAARATTWYEAHGPAESDVLSAIKEAKKTGEFVRPFVFALLSSVAAVALWVLFVLHEPAGAP